jgi:hypothetical protein
MCGCHPGLIACTVVARSNGVRKHETLSGERER